MSYLVRITQDNGNAAEVIFDPAVGKRWNVVYPIDRKHWKWGLIGNYEKIGSDAYKLASTDGVVVLSLLKFSDPPQFGTSGRATIGAGAMSPNARWEVLATAEQLAEVKREVDKIMAEMNEIYKQIAIDVVGCIDPTPISDTIGAKMAYDKGDMIGAGLSLIAFVPYLGDALAKTTKGARFLKKLNDLRERLKTVTRVLSHLKERIAIAARESAERLRKHLKNISPKMNSRVMRNQVSSYLSDIAGRAGMRPEHLNNWRIFCSHSKPPKLTIIRKRNKAALKWENHPNCTPKPVWCKLKTAKSGPNEGLVIYPRKEDFSNLEDYKDMVEHAEKLKKKYQCKFEPDGPGGVMVRYNGKFHADFDKMGVYNITATSNGTHGKAWKGDLHNDDPQMKDFINKEIYGGVRNDQHGGQDFHFTDYDDVKQMKKHGRTPDKDEMNPNNEGFLIIHPNGDVGMANYDKLREVYKRYGIQNPYEQK